MYDYSGLTPGDMARMTEEVGEMATVGAVAAIGTVVIIWAFIAFAVGVLQIVAMWKVFTKAGQKGWKAIIPIYNMVILLKIAGLSPWLLLICLTGFIPVLGALAILGLNIAIGVKVSEAFGKSGGFAVGLILLPPIFYMILGFGEATYQGVENKTQEQ